MKKNNNKNQSSNRYNSKKLNNFNSNNYTCSGCGKQGHIKADCPNNENKERGASKKFEKKGKAKRAYIAWQDNEYLPLTHHQMKMKRQICALWKRENQKQAV